MFLNAEYVLPPGGLANLRSQKDLIDQRRLGIQQDRNQRGMTPFDIKVLQNPRLQINWGQIQVSSGQGAGGYFTDPYLRLIAGVENQTTIAIMADPSTVHIFIPATAEKAEKPLATMFPTVPKHRSARESRLGLNSRIAYANLPPCIRSASSQPRRKNNNLFRNSL